MSPVARQRTVDIRPVTPERWADFERLFSARGAPHYCWCTPFRFDDAHEKSNDDKRAAMRKLVSRATPIGVLAYDGGEPAGWCSIAPRESYVKLRRSRTMPRVTPAETRTWTILCFFIPRPARGRGIARALLRGAIAYARAQGAEVLEAYPFDSAGTTATHRGPSTLYAAEHFKPDGRRWSLTL